MNRRLFLELLAVPLPALTQGVSNRVARPQPKPKFSGLPFRSRLVDVSVQAGLRSPTVYGRDDRKDYILETIGCGCAFIDYDNDGWPDIFILCGTRLEDAPPDSTNRLYHNNRDGTFTDVTKEAGLWKTGWASGVCVGDYDNDGYDDLFVTCYGQNILYRNNGNGTFTDATKEAGLVREGTNWGAGCTFLDYDRDGHLDLFVSNYLEFDPRQVPKPGEAANCNWKGIPVNCGPRGLSPGRHLLYSNDGKGVFTDVSESSGISKATESYGMTAVAADFDNDGWPNIFVACDSTPSFYFRNQRDGTFAEEALPRGVALNEDGMEQAGMGVGVGDFDLDGDLDIFKTHFADDSSILYRNDGKGNFEDVTVRAGIAVETRFVGWGTGITDLDNDGRPDLFCVTGSVYPEIEKHLPQYPYRTPRLVFRGLTGDRFEELIEEAGPGVAERHTSRGCAFGDFDNDGDIDILIVNLNEPPSLLRNDVTGNNTWLKVKLIGTKSNRSAIGARVTAIYGGKRQSQVVLSQSSFYSANELRLHFGLGLSKQADLEVRWPNGRADTFRAVAANHLIVIKEEHGIIERKKIR